MNASPRAAAAAAAVPAAITALRSEHQYQARLLQALDKQVGLLNQDLEPDVEVLYGVMHYMTNYPDRYHHPKEDLIFERVAQRDPSMRPVVDKLQAAHDAIGRAGQELFRLIEGRYGDGSDDGGDAGAGPERWHAIRDRARSYVDSLRRHMDIENLHLFPKAMAGLGEADWREIDADAQPLLDPVFGGEVAEVYLTLHERYVNDEKQVSIGRKAANLMEVVALIEALTAIFGGMHRIRRVIGEHSRSTSAENRKLLAQWSRTTEREQRRALMQHLARMNKERAAGVRQRVEQLWSDARAAAADPYDPRHGEHGARWLRPRRLRSQEQT